MNIAFKEYGSGNAVILLHAFPLSRKMWQPQIEALTAANFRVITPDLRGFGDNDSFADINTMEDMARDIAELTDTLKIEKAIFGGLSMGGYILFNFFRLFPEKIAALVFADTNSAADTEQKREGRFDLIENIEQNGAQALIDEMLPNLVSNYTKNNNQELLSEIEKMFREVNPKAAIAALRGMAERQDHSDCLSEISLPTLLIFGEDDKVTNLEIAREMDQKIPNSKLEIIKNAGHYSNLEQPESFNSVLVDFCQTIEF
ncbi:MAG TPA: alpha/beta fold hydrolase [Pyrinomonadaceae bacterium]|nr:alpha/beta fold hydrolase [Pyrinomonadaceae bacterium]